MEASKYTKRMLEQDYSLETHYKMNNSSTSSRSSSGRADDESSERSGDSIGARRVAMLAKQRRQALEEELVQLARIEHDKYLHKEYNNLLHTIRTTGQPSFDEFVGILQRVQKHEMTVEMAMERIGKDLVLGKLGQQD